MKRYLFVVLLSTFSMWGCSTAPTAPATVPTIITLSVNVTDVAQVPIPTAKVELFNADGSYGKGTPAYTDLNGNIAISVLRGADVRLLVSKAGYQGYGYTTFLTHSTALYVTLGPQ